MENNSKIPEAVLERLPQYLNYLQEIKDTVPSISATSIAKGLELGDVQVRKDLAMVSHGGRPKVGYNTEALIEDISSFLGCNNMTKAVIVGAGKIGRAILDYEGFTRYGVEILAAFSHHANQVIDTATRKPILPLESFKSFCSENNVQIGIITVPVKYAQEVCDMMVSCGITGIWNFARKTLNVPSNVIVRQEDLAASVAILSCKLKGQK